MINALTTFQTYINYTLHGLVNDFYIVYFNNIFIFSRTEVEHHYYLKHVIKYLYCIKLYANSKKYEFFKFKVEYLDFIINKEDI